VIFFAAAAAWFYTHPGRHSLRAALGIWQRWDGSNFVRITHHGYGAFDGAAAFYPLYPGLVGVLGRIIGGHYALAGAIVAVAACFVAFVLLHALAVRLLGADAAGRTVIYLAVFPTTLFLQAVYSESLYLAIAVAAFLLAERGYWGWAALTAGGAFLTRPVGLAVIAGLGVLAWHASDRNGALRRLALAPLVFLVYPLGLWWQIGKPFAFVHAETGHGGVRHLSATGPFGGIWDGARAAWAGLEQVVSGSHTHHYWNAPALADVDPIVPAIENLADFCFLLLFAALTIVAWRRLGAAYGVFAAVSLAIPLSVPSASTPLLSLDRFGLVVFPLFLALATLGGRRWAHLAILCSSGTLLGFGIYYFAKGNWIG
jgi:hypothetical protein